MEGNSASLLNNDESAGWESDPLTGIIPRSVAHLFTILNSISNCEYSVKISFIELYNEELSDLLSESTDKLRIYDDPARKGSVVIPGLEEVVVRNKNEVYKILQKGADKRQKASTLMNSQSSRSHSIFTITVFIREKSLEGEEIIKVGKLNLVDLAGSENIERSGATGKRAAEAGKINKSLTTLGRVITALVEHRDHIPYRESNLTRLLQDSLGGKTKTTIIATISPALCNLEETLSTLDYAHKAKSIRNKPEINQKLIKKTLIKEYTEEIDKLKRELWATREKNGIYLPNDLHESMVAKLDEQKEEIRELLNKITALNEEIDKVNDLFKETKQSLDDKCVQLACTQKILTQTESNLRAAKQECEESKYVIEERIKTENALVQQAQELHCVNKQADLDCQQLHAKIARLSGVAAKNKSLLELFSQKMTSNLRDILIKEAERTNDHKESMCGLCEQLSEIDAKLNEMKSDVLCELHVYDEHSQAWLDELGKLLSSEIDTNCAQFYARFVASLDSNGEFLREENNSQISLCSHHKELFHSTLSEIKRLVDKIELNSSEFSGVFAAQANEYLKTNKQEIQTQSSEYVANLDRLSRSIEVVQKDMNELKTAQHDLQSSVFEAIDTLQSTILQMSAKFRHSFQQLDEKCQEIAFKNTASLSELAQIKDLIKVKEKELVLNRANEFNEKIQQPVKNLIESNSTCLKGLNSAVKQLGDNYDLNDEKLTQSISNLFSKQAETNENVKVLVNERLSSLTQMNSQIQTNIVNEKTYSDEFFVRLNRDSVGRECDAITSTIKKSLQVSEMTQMSMENLSEMSKQFYAEAVQDLEALVRKEFQEDRPSGVSPQSKRYFNEVELARTKRNTLLVEEFRAKRSLELPLGEANTLKVSSESSSSRPCSPAEMVPDTPVVVPAKRSATEKENSERSGTSSGNSKNTVKTNPTKMRKLNNVPLVEKN